jgi:hypothetical protein
MTEVAGTDGRKLGGFFLPGGQDDWRQMEAVGEGDGRKVRVEGRRRDVPWTAVPARRDPQLAW